MSETVFGRARELRSVERFLDGILVHPGVLTVEGEMGAGKTALWKAAAAAGQRRGYRVLACHPVESEQSLAFAALGDLLEGVLDDAQLQLPEPQDRALRVAVLMADPEGQPPDQRSVSVATLGAIRSISQRAPVLLAIDDLQWMDRASARVLEFAVRRLESERVGVVAAFRPSDHIPMLLDRSFSDRLERLILAPLESDALDALFRQRLGESVTRPTLAQIAEASGGNPLFALELARGILRDEIQPMAGEPLSIPGTLQQLVRHRLAALPPNVRELLFIGAAVTDPTLELLERFSGRAGSVSASVDVAVAAGVVEVTEGGLRFTHPLFASTLYHAVPVARRQTLHRRLAAFAGGTAERARHLALGARGPDVRVAAALDEAARATAARGAADAAADLHEQAYRLTPSTDGDARNRRRMEAAECHFAAGDLDRARQIMEETAVALAPGPVRAAVLRRLAKVRYRNDSCSVAAELLTRALTEAGDDSLLCAAIERDLAWAVMQCGDMRDAAEHASSALRLVEASDNDEMLGEVLAANAMADFLLGGGLPADTMRRASNMEGLRPETPIEWRPSMMLAMMLKWSGDTPEARRRFDELHQRALEAGEETSLPFLLAQMSETETWEGDWATALKHAEEAHKIALQTGQEPIRAAALYSKGLVEAHLGRADEARTSARAGLELSERVGSVLMMMLNQSVLGMVQLSRDDPVGADAHLAPLIAWLEVVGIREPGVLRFVPEEVEALVGIGKLDRADALLTGYEVDAARLGRPWALLAAARCRALITAAGGDARVAAVGLDRALKDHGSAVQRFERARALYVLGTIQRRTRQRKAARESLEASLELFETLGAEVWSARAQRMLGGKQSSPGTHEDPELTPAERRVARFVASGATNREAASRLFVSVRAVELHLTNIYRKLGIRSRTELAVRMAKSRAASRGTEARRRKPTPSRVVREP
ncbi:MAG: AAA family ATPase [Candidatus Limnocylindria bacterium]